MLVLTRKPGQSVYIGEDVKVTLMEIRGNQVRVGIDAPSTVRIYREEIYLQIMEENKRASEISPEAPKDLADVAESWKSKKPAVLNQMNFSSVKPDGGEEG